MTSVRDYVLGRILADHIRVRVHVESQEPEVFYYHRGRCRWYKKVVDYHPKSGRARFRFGPRRQTLYRNVLVWMFVNRRAPDGGDRVDHRDGNRENDHPDNLRAHTHEESCRQGGEVQVDRVLNRCLAYFGYIAFLGVEPDHELSDAEVADYAAR